MALKDDVQGYWQIAKNSKYLLSYVGLMKPEERTQDVTFAVYTKVFSRELKKMKRASNRLTRINNRFVITSTIDLEIQFIETHYKWMKKYLGSAVDSDNLKFLEVGAGYGRTIYPLAALFPKAEFSGIEYTEAGPVAAAEYIQKCLDEIQYVVGKVEPSAAQNVPIVKSLQQGDGKNLQYPDKSFDVSYTNLVLEQIPYPEDHLKVLSEMHRVTKRFCFFLEPWQDAQDPITAAYLHYNDYFRARSKTLYQAGFKKVTFIPLGFQHNLKFKLGYVVAEV